MVSVVKLMDFKSQTTSKTPFREPSPAISHLLKLASSPEKTEILWMCQLDSWLIIRH